MQINRNTVLYERWHCVLDITEFQGIEYIKNKSEKREGQKVKVICWNPYH